MVDDPTVKKDVEAAPFKIVNSEKVMLGLRLKEKNILHRKSHFYSSKNEKMDFQTINFRLFPKSGMITVPAYFNDAQRQATKRGKIIT